MYMKFNPKDAERWISENAPNGIKCQCCEKKDWIVEKDVMEVYPFRDGREFRPNEAGYLYLAARCKGCGNTMFFRTGADDDVL
jgi:hypothetical protein